MGVFTWIATAATGFTALLVFAFVKYPWLKYDIRYIIDFLNAGIPLIRYKRKNTSLVDLFERNVTKHPEKTCLIFEGKHYSYKCINSQANKVANLGLKLGWKCGDMVALLIHNEPAFVWTYIGLMKIGVKMPLLNFNLRSKSLLHCLQVNTGLKAIIIGQGNQLKEAITEIYDDLFEKPVLLLQGSTKVSEGEQFQIFDELMNESPDDPIDSSVRKHLTYKDTVCYIYTSGTTGLPKAAVVTQSKVMKGAHLMFLSYIKADDVIYTPLPLYHSAAGLIGLGAALNLGATLVLRDKFSASQFWNDCRKYDVTVVQYIGELCRYLIAQPKSDNDKDHKVWLAFGNGLRKDIFSEFRERFGIRQIGEFYAATEGNAGFFSNFNKPGCIGRMTPFLSMLSPMSLIKYDFDTAEPMRNEHGLCMQVKKGEKGLMVSKINKLQEFDGYQGNKDLTAKKMLMNVFKKDDKYFNTGDILIQDEEGFVYFCDRIGDTYRWKGENVSTIEVSNVMSDVNFIDDANVYGVEIQGQDGRCGMVSLTLSSGNSDMTLDELKHLYQHCEDLLPVYARPRFLRIKKQAVLTNTFKQQKFTLVKEGFNPDHCHGDNLYCIDQKNKSFLPLDNELYQNIINGNIRL